MTDGDCHVLRVDDDVDVSIALILSIQNDPTLQYLWLDFEKEIICVYYHKFVALSLEIRS